MVVVSVLISLILRHFPGRRSDRDVRFFWMDIFHVLFEMQNLVDSGKYNSIIPDVSTIRVGYLVFIRIVIAVDVIEIIDNIASIYFIAEHCHSVQWQRIVRLQLYWFFRQKNFIATIEDKKMIISSQLL